MRNVSRILVIVGCLLSAASVSSANSIVNGSFESPTVWNVGPGWALFTSIPGWTATADFIEIGAAGLYGVTGYDGKQVLELDANNNAVVGQIVLTADTSYTLSFLYAARAGIDLDSVTFEVYWNNVLVQAFAPTLTAMTLYSTNVTALAVNTLRFTGTGTNDSLGAIIDDVQLNSVPDAGSTATLLGLGLLGLGYLRRRLQ